MRAITDKVLLAFLALAAGAGAAPVFADDACIDFKWDVSAERSLFAAAPLELTAGHDAASAPAVAPNRLYRLRLTAQDRVAFAVPPGKKAVDGAAMFAGLATLKIAAPGSYRISIDLPSWIDVVSNGSLMQPTDYQGQHGCRAPHKIVVFDFAAAQSVVLQLSNDAQESVLLSVTPAPRRKY